MNTYSMWQIANAHFDQPFEKEVVVDGHSIQLLITDYEGFEQSGHPYFQIFHDYVRTGLFAIKDEPTPMDCIYVITKEPYPNELSGQLEKILGLCLRVVYYPPIQISYAGRYVINGASGFPTWDCNSIGSLPPTQTIQSDTFDKALNYFTVLIKRNLSFYGNLEHVYRTTNINDITIALPALWSFVEGFWHPLDKKAENSNIDTSFENMLLTDFMFELSRDRSEEESGRWKEHFYSQNTMLMKFIMKSTKKIKTVGKIRHILAHGRYLHYEPDWKTEEWQIIYQQRNDLLEIVVQSLINRIQREMQENSEEKE